MANITISELRPVGSELFQDSESFLNELTDREMEIFGGTRGRGGNRSVFSNNNTAGNTQGNNVSNYNSNKVGC